MIPYDMDPRLHTAEPEAPQLDDGFSPRHHDDPQVSTAEPLEPPAGADWLGDKSLF
jgi:hypothetical protein